VSAYSDLMALARLCLRQASAARTAAAAEELRSLAKEYEDCAAAIKESLSRSSTQAPSPFAQQQQRPQSDPKPAGLDPEIGLRDDAQHWSEHAERLRARAAQLTDGAGRLVILQIAETYEALARRAARRPVGSAND
jgi:hypothetical protein